MRFAPIANAGLDLARVLVVHGKLAPRLTLQTLLQAGGYAVDVAGSSWEALSKLDAGCYDLVLTDGADGTQDVLAYARVKDYRPATAVVTSFEPEFEPSRRRGAYEFSIHTEDVPQLLGKVADLIAMRASRRYR
jgi:DNA-binding NtrC family response regulator